MGDDLRTIQRTAQVKYAASPLISSSNFSAQCRSAMKQTRTLSTERAAASAPQRSCLQVRHVARVQQKEFGGGNMTNKSRRPNFHVLFIQVGWFGDRGVVHCLRTAVNLEAKAVFAK